MEVRLGSVGNGNGGPEALMLDTIYMYLLKSFGQDIYSRIGINQIGNDLEEFVLKEPGNRIHVNIRYPFVQDFDLKSPVEKNLIGLDIIHNALLRIAEYDGKLDIAKIESIKNKILENKFHFEFTYKTYANKRNENLVGRMVVAPLFDRFVYSVVIEEFSIEICRQVIFIGLPGLFYGSKYFAYGKWVAEKLIISGRQKEVEIHVFIRKCAVEYLNMTPYDAPPYFTLMKFGVSESEREKACKDWIHSLPPAVAAAIRQADN